jgi:hypothetical protein
MQAGERYNKAGYKFELLSQRNLNYDKNNSNVGKDKKELISHMMNSKQRIKKL